MIDFNLSKPLVVGAYIAWFVFNGEAVTAIQSALGTLYWIACLGEQRHITKEPRMSVSSIWTIEFYIHEQAGPQASFAGVCWFNC